MRTLRGTLVRPLAALLLGATLAPLAHGAHAAEQPEKLGPNIVANGGFETGSNPGVQLAIPVGAPLLGSWTAINNEVRVVGTNWQAEEGGRSLSLGNWGANASPIPPFPTGASGVKQVLTTKAGQRYHVVFYQAGNPFDHQPSTVRIQIGGTMKDFTYQSDTKATPEKMEWIQRSFVFTAAAASTPLGLYAYYTPGNDPLGLDNVQVRAILDAASPANGTPGPGPAAGAIDLRILSASLAGGSRQTLHVITTANASVALVIDYPDGTQAMVPGHAGVDGTYAYTWTITSAMHGTVHITVDSAGRVAQGTFTVT